MQVRVLPPVLVGNDPRTPAHPSAVRAFTEALVLPWIHGLTTAREGPPRNKLPVRVRWAKPADLEEVLQVMRTLDDHGRWDKSTLATTLGGGCHSRVADHQGRAVGFLVYELIRRSTILVYNLGVLPEYRRRGVGAALIGDILDRLDATPCRRLVAYCWEYTLDAQCFLRSQGFRAVGAQPSAIGAGDVYRFVRRLGGTTT